MKFLVGWVTTEEEAGLTRKPDIDMTGVMKLNVLQDNTDTCVIEVEAPQATLDVLAAKYGVWTPPQ